MNTTAAVPLTDWFGPDVKPVRVGVYETRSTWDGFSWWNGKCWGKQFVFAASAFEDPTVGSQDIEWRGRRCWVLTIENCLGTRYLVHARPKSQKFGFLQQARPFKSQRAAERFAARYPRLGLTAVLP